MNIKCVGYTCACEIKVQTLLTAHQRSTGTLWAVSAAFLETQHGQVFTHAHTPILTWDLHPCLIAMGNITAKVTDKAISHGEYFNITGPMSQMSFMCSEENKGPHIGLNDILRKTNRYHQVENEQKKVSKKLFSPLVLFIWE